MSVVAGLSMHPDATPNSVEERFGVYRESIREYQSRGEKGRVSYYLASLALEELAIRTNMGEEPMTSSFDDIEYRFALAADLNVGEDKLYELRSRLLHAWIRPIVWSGVINIDGLSTAQARRVAETIQLPQAADTTAAIAASALKELDEKYLLDMEHQDRKQEKEYKYLKGFLNETTPILLAARHTTAKQFALPSTAYDDDINPDVATHVDGFYYDNRQSRSGKPRFSYQVTTDTAHYHVGESIPQINARLLGNNAKSSRWPKDDRPFGTLRRLVTERKGRRLSKDAQSTLDRIGSSVFNFITTHPQK